MRLADHFSLVWLKREEEDETCGRRSQGHKHAVPKAEIFVSPVRDDPSPGQYLSVLPFSTHDMIVVNRKALVVPVDLEH